MGEGLACSGSAPSFLLGDWYVEAEETMISHRLSVPVSEARAGGRRASSGSLECPLQGSARSGNNLSYLASAPLSAGERVGEDEG